MTLRSRLFLLLGALIAVFAVGQWWLVRSLTRDLSDELGEVAFTVGTSVISAIGSGEVGSTGTLWVDGEAVCEGRIADCPDLPPRVIDLATRWQEKAVVTGDADAGERIEVVAEGSSDGPTHRILRRHVIHRRVGDERLAGESATDLGSPLQDLPHDGDRPGPSFVFKVRHGDDAATEASPAGSPGLPEGPEAERLGGDAEPFTVAYLSLTEAGEDRVLVFEDERETTSIPVPRSGVDDQLEGFVEKLTYGSLALLGAGLLLAGVVAHRATAPLKELREAARKVGDGAVGTQAAVPADPEMARAVVAFNRMSRDLARLDEDARQLRAREHLAELGEVARGLAHTLRNPLNALGLSVDELAGAAAADERSELATSARRQIQRLDRAIRSFLVLAAQGSGDGAPEPVDVARLARDVALEALQDARGRVGVDVESATDDSAATSVDAVAGELRAVLQALVVNAVEASPRGERVEVRVGPAAAGRVRVEVADRGPGLAAEVRERLFAPHVSTKPTGSGMGLFLCQRIASSRYGGRVELRDRDGGGTVAVLEVGDRDAAVGEPA